MRSRDHRAELSGPGRVGASRGPPYSLYTWKKNFAKASLGEMEKDFEIRRLKKELARALEGRDILKIKATACFA